VANFALLTVVRTFTSNTSQPAPNGLVGTARAQLWASSPGGGGCSAISGSTGGGAGGAGYAEEPALAISGGFVVTIPAGGAGGAGTVGVSGGNPGDSSIAGDSVTVLAHSGTPGTCSSSNGAAGSGAVASGNTIAFGGGNGSPGVSSGHGGAAGGGAGSAGAGSGNTGGSPDGGNGGAQQNTINTAGNPGSAFGGGGGGARGGGSIRTGGAGVTGKAVITYTVLVPLGGTANEGRTGLRPGSSRGSMGAPFTPVGPPVPPPFYAPQEQQRGAKQLRPGGYRQAKGAPYTAPPPFHLSPLKAQQAAHAGRKGLRPGTSRKQRGAPVVPFPIVPVNQWTGTVTHSPVWGPSLPGLASCVVNLTPASSTGLGTGTPTAGNWLFVIAGWNAAAGPATVNVGCDSHQWWRPAAPSNAAGMTRTTIWYQPNIIPPSCVYVAPSAFMDGLAVTVIEVPLGPWDQVTTLASNYAAGATSLPLSAALPSAAAFMVAAVTGDNAAAGTALTPGGWTPLTTVTSVNGTDATGDTVLAAATITTASAQSIAGSASSSENISGMILSVLQHAPSPVPGGLNPNWPYLFFEAAFGSGYGTPPDQMTWTNLQTVGNGMRLRDWSETTGIQYELGALESSEGQLELDNPDGALSPGNPSSPWFPNVQPGTPVRIRAVTAAADRWYVIQRNVERWPQQWDDQFRGVANTVINDQWSVINKELPTPYRAEVLADAPYAWWPCDDPVTNNATSLVNAAPGNTLPLNITIAPGGLASVVNVGTPGDGASYSMDFSAVEQFAQDSGWMYGDPDSAAWQQTGTGSASTGRYLQCTDANFPPLAGGVTVEGWWNFTWAKTAPPNPNFQFGPDGQPAANLVLWELNTGSGAVASLFLDSSGHLRFTFGGSTTTVYSGSDLRNVTWFGATVAMTATTWTAWLNGGVVAKVSGSGSATSAWSVFTANAVAAGTSGIGNPEISHLAVYGTALPAPRVMAHFAAAYTAGGQLPQPSPPTLQFIPTLTPAPDGIMHTGTFFKPPTAIIGTNSTLSAVVTGTGGGLTSAPAIPSTWDWCQSVGSGQSAAGDYAWLAASGPAAPQYTWYTAAGSGNEQGAGTTVANSLFVNSYGSGASPPTAGSPLGDSVGNRLERLLQAGGVTSPARCIDAASAAVVAGLDTGGQASGSALGAIVSSDSGLLFMNNLSNLMYFGRTRLAAMPVRWQLGPNIAAGQIPYQFTGGDDAGLDTDPQRVQNVIQVTQFDVTGAQTAGAAAGSAETSGPLVFAPDAARHAGVLASQAQNGPCEAKTTSYLQDQTLIQAQANWLFDQFGNARQRITNLTVRAEASSGICPAAWLFVLGANVGDVFSASFTPPGQPPFTGLWRISKITRRRISFDQGEALVSIIGDVYTTEWP
jgi:hypothetical protein